MSDNEIALAHYRIQFPDLASLGSAPGCATWKAEYDRLVAGGFSATLITGSASDGQNTTAQRNFDQKVLIAAVLTRRAELDTAFDDHALAPVQIKPRRRLGYVVSLD